jgi:hypothetical protein
MQTFNRLVQDTTGYVEPMDLNREINGAGTQFTLFCTNLSKFSSKLASLVMCFLSGITKGDNWLIARASFVGRQEPAAGVAKGGYGREGGGYTRVGFFHWWLSS